VAVTPFRALAVAHLQSTWNRLRKQMGTSGIWAFVAVVIILAVTTVLPLLASLGALGWVVGYSFSQGRDVERAIAFGAMGISALTLFAGVMGGLSSGSRQLPWETLRAFPVRSFTLFRAELFAGAGEAITFVELSALTVTCLGACIGSPRATPLFVVLLLTHAVALLALQQLAGSVAQRLSRRLRAMLIVLPLAAVSMSWLAPMLARRLEGGPSAGTMERVSFTSRWFPARLLLDAAEALTAGRATVAQLVVAVLVPTVLTGALVLGAWIFVARERPMAVEDQGGPPAKLWGFETQVMGIARLTWETLSQSLPGRFGLLMPLFTIVLIRGPLAEILPSRGWTAPIAFGYASLAGTNLLFNQFGLDRHGVKVLFLLPVDLEAMLRGKLLGFAAWQAAQAALLLVLLVLTGHRDPVDLLVGLALYACVFLILAMVGQFSSIWQPRPLRKNGLRASQPPLAVVLLMFGSLLTAGALLYGIVFGVKHFAPGWELPVLGVVFFALLGLVLPVLHVNALFLARSREKLVEVLGSSG